MDYKELKQEEVLLLDRICVILSNPAINKSLLLKTCGIERMTLVHYLAKKRCGFTSENIQALRNEILRVRSEINNAFLSNNTTKATQVLKNKEILYTNILLQSQQVRLSAVRTGKRRIERDEILEIKDSYMRLSIQMNL